ncbi:MAG: site-2 protease family protein [Armatimonadota bacterium]
MFGSSFRIGRISGITISVDYSWFIIFGLFVYLLASGYFPLAAPDMQVGWYWGISVFTSLLFFGSVVAHEMSHALVARRRGIPIKNITLFIFGGVAQMEDEPKTPGDEFKMAIAGPLASIGMAVIFFGIALLFAITGSQLFFASFTYLWFINVILAVFNMLPGFPLDGGRVFRSMLWKILGNLRRATRIASITGQMFGWALIALGIGSLFIPALRSGGSLIWFALVGWFLVSAAKNSYQQVVLRETLQAVPISDVMSSNAEAVPPDITVERLVTEYFLKDSPSTLPVERDGLIQGTVSVDDVRAMPRERWVGTLVSEVMKPLGDEQVVGLNTDAWEATNRMAQTNSDRVIVAEGNHVEGLVTRGSIVRWLQTHSGRGLAPGQA